MPVIFCTAREGQDDVVAGLQAGADDYLRKPIRRMEFLARIEAVTRRARRIDEKADAFQIECFHVDCTNRAITRDGRQLDLTSKDFDLALLFLANLGRLLSRSYISQTVWGTSCPVTSRTIDTHISRIRGKLGLVYKRGWELKAVYGHGYRLEQSQPAALFSPSKRGSEWSADDVIQ